MILLGMLGDIQTSGRGHFRLIRHPQPSLLFARPVVSL
jgi:hypothetical protein